MKPFILFLLIAAIGNAIYHIGQKTLAPTTNPMVLLMAVYGFAFIFSAVASPFMQINSATFRYSQVISWPVFVLAAGVFLIEIGFLLAYRTGVSLQWSGVAVNGAAAVLLIPIAVFIFRESFSIIRIAGILLTISGLALITRQ